MQFLFQRTAILKVAFSYMLTFGVFCISSANAQEQECDGQTRLTHSFSSGAAWSICADVSDIHGLSLKDIRYRAPGDRERSVLSDASAAQILPHLSLIHI